MSKPARSTKRRLTATLLALALMLACLPSLATSFEPPKGSTLSPASSPISIKDATNGAITLTIINQSTPTPEPTATPTPTPTSKPLVTPRPTPTQRPTPTRTAAPTPTVRPGRATPTPPADEEYMRITIGGKLVPEDVWSLYAEYALEEFWEIEQSRDWTFYDDLTIISLEGTISADDEGMEAALNELYRSNVEVIGAANARILERGIDGAVETVDTIRRSGVIPVGVTTDGSGVDNLLMYPIAKKSGTYLIGILSYTQDINDLGIAATTEAERAAAVKSPDPNTVWRDVERARNLGADLVILDIHWAQSHTAEQNALLEEIILSGADIVAGFMPETVWEFDLREVAGRQVLVLESMGNFLAGATPLTKNDAGALVRLSWKLDPLGNKIDLSIEEANRLYMTTWTAADTETGLRRIIDADAKEYQSLTWMTSEEYERMSEAHKVLRERLAEEPVYPIYDD